MVAPRMLNKQVVLRILYVDDIVFYNSAGTIYVRSEVDKFLTSPSVLELVDLPVDSCKL